MRPRLLFDPLPDRRPQGCDTHLPLLQGLHLHIQAYMLTTDSCIFKRQVHAHTLLHIVLLQVGNMPAPHFFYFFFAMFCVALPNCKCSLLFELAEYLLYISFCLQSSLMYKQTSICNVVHYHWNIWALGPCWSWRKPCCVSHNTCQKNKKTLGLDSLSWRKLWKKLVTSYFWSRLWNLLSCKWTHVHHTWLPLFFLFILVLEF